jgi:hypothetical protein
MFYPILIAITAAAIYIGLQQEYFWMISIQGYFDVITSKWTHPHILATNTAIQEDWNILYHLGGNGPWIPRKDGPFGDELRIPEGCQIEQMHVVGAMQHFFLVFVPPAYSNLDGET